MTDNVSDKWVKVSEAAVVLGVSERTIWRRVKAGELDIDRSVTPHLVRVSDTVSDNVVTEGVKVAEVSELEAEVERLSREVDRLEELLSEIRSERDYLRSAHAAALSTSQRLLEHIEEPEEVEEGPVGVLQRVTRWLGGGR
jgi:hypothetical protein